MSVFKRHITVAAALLAVGAAAMAQDSSSSSVVRRGGADRNRKEQTQPGVTERMQKFYEESPKSDADMQWMRVIYRELDLNKPKNASLYYPEDIIDGDKNLFRIIMEQLADNRIPAYEYLDGREIFTDQYKLKVGDMLDRFHIYYTPAKGSTEKNPRYVIEEVDVPTNEVLSYYILERWEFDSRSNNMRTRVEAICPVLHRSGDFGGEAMKYPMFWVRMEALRPYLSQQYIFIDDDNNLPKYTLDDFFAMNMYEGDIYKTRNLRNQSMMQMYPDPDDLKRAQDSIQQRLDSFDKKLWVPSREEVIAAREAREAAAAGDSIVIPDRDTKAKSARSSRARKTPKKKEPKSIKSKSSNSSNSAVRSVRRRK